MILSRVGCTLLLLSTFQSAPSQSARPALLVGQVVDAASGRPVAGAIVAIGGAATVQGQLHPRVLTGSDGRFVFRDVRRGEYRITATKAGYGDAAYGRRFAGGAALPLLVNEGARIGDLVIRLWRHAAISGTIVDESGERLVGVQVRAFRRTVVAGRRRFVSSNLGTSDDRGLYRVGGLLPGDYLVATVARQTVVPLSYYRAGGPVRSLPAGLGLASPAESAAQAFLHAGHVGIALGRGTPVPPPPVDGRLFVYPSTFHPSTTNGTAGAVITLGPGEDYVNGDLQLTPVPTARVSGWIVSPEGPLGGGLLRLVPANTTELLSETDLPTVVTDVGGAFSLPAVPAGHYNLHLAGGGTASGRGSIGPLWLDGTLAAGTEDIDGVTLMALPPVRVSGRVEFEGASARPRSLSTIGIMIEPAEIIPVTAASFTRPSATGEFVSQPLRGGRYYIRVPNSPAGWMFKSATVDGRDVADIPFDLREEPTNVVVTFTDRWSGVRGTVEGAAGRDEGALVLVFPTDRDTWGSSGLNPRRVRSTRTSKLGEYSFNLPPGDYYLLAVPEELSSEWQDPEFLDAASRGATRVRIADGERRTQDLKTRDVR